MKLKSQFAFVCYCELLWKSLESLSLFYKYMNHLLAAGFRLLKWKNLLLFISFLVVNEAFWGLTLLVGQKKRSVRPHGGAHGNCDDDFRLNLMIRMEKKSCFTVVVKMCGCIAAMWHQGKRFFCLLSSCFCMWAEKKVSLVINQLTLITGKEVEWEWKWDYWQWGQIYQENKILGLKTQQ